MLLYVLHRVNYYRFKIKVHTYVPFRNVSAGCMSIPKQNRKHEYATFVIAVSYET
jgi:hypothetical protein